MANSHFVAGFTAILSLTFFLGLAVIEGSPAGDVPQAEISNGPIHARLYLPDAHQGYYRGVRFDWSGAFASLQYKGHEYYGQWYNRVDAAVHDFQYEGAEIVASTCSGVTGPVEEFQTHHSALGFDEAKLGGTFIKIGVGVLRKDAQKYDFVHQYELVNPGKWDVQKHSDSVEFTQELTDPATGYGYVYHKTVRLVPGKAEMVLAHRLKNTGSKPIETAVYNHNFLVLDHQPPGPDFTIAFPFELTSPHPPKAGMAELRGKQFVYLKTLTGEDTVSAPLEGFGNSSEDYNIRIENHKVGAGMLIRGNRPLASMNFWSIRTILAVEPYVAMTIQPGQEYTWEITYQYYTLPADGK